MSRTATAAPPQRRRFSRVWLPFFIVMFGASAIVLAWNVSDDLEVAQRRFMTLIASAVTLFLLLLWFVFLSPVRWGTVLVSILLPTTLGAATIKEIQISHYGQFLPGVVWRWEKSDAEILEEHRQKQGKADDVVQLSSDDSADFPAYRGRKRDGIAIGPALNRDWSARPPRELWRAPCGGGYAAFAVSGNLAVTIEQRGNEEVVVAYDTATGKERWSRANDGKFFEAMGGTGPRATPTIAGGDVYSLGALGKLSCFEAATGKEKWSADILRDNENIKWGMTGSPLVYDNLVVVNPGSQTEETKGRAVVAYDRKTGKEVWAAGDTRSSYSSPQLATLGGTRQILLVDANTFAGYDAGNGRRLWSQPWVTPNEINVAQPIVVDGERVFVSSGYGHGCALLKITPDNNGNWSVQTLWENKAMRCKFTSPVLYQGHLYGIDEGGEGILSCVEVETGKKKWRDGRFAAGQLLLSGDLLIVQAEKGTVTLVEATPEGYRPKGSIDGLSSETERVKTWNLPALANGRLYLRNEKEMACYDLR